MPGLPEARSQLQYLSAIGLTILGRDEPERNWEAVDRFLDLLPDFSRDSDHHIGEWLDSGRLGHFESGYHLFKSDAFFKIVQ